MNLPLNIDLQQILLHLFNFVILAGGLYLLLYKPVKDFMDKRAAYYENLDREAKAKLKEAEELNSNYREQLEAVDKEIAQKRAQAEKELQDQCDSELQSTREQAAKLIATAQAEAEQERERILSDAQNEIAGMAIAATQKLLYRSVSETYDQFLAGAEGSVSHE